MRRAERGLTLLEVLGAVALLGILYTVLAGSAIGGLRSEGESRRRLEASLLADERMAEIELSLESGVAPPAGSTREERDGFTVETEVRAFERPPPRADAQRSSGPRSLAARRAAAGQQDAPSLFGPPASRTAPPPLRTIDVVVRWEEGIDAREVRRTTYALDAEAAAEILASISTAQAPAEGEPDDADSNGRDGRRAGEPLLPRFPIPALEDPGDER